MTKTLTMETMTAGTKATNIHPDCFGFTTTRHGGYGTGAYASFNCSPFCGDDPDTVSRNQQLLLKTFPLPPQHLIIPHQNHGSEVLCADAEYLSLPAASRAALLQGVDAVITNQRQCCICVSTADCIPIQVYDPIHKVVAIVHAGWRGTVQKLLTKTLRFMQEHYQSSATNLLAYIGPGISAQSFEVGDEVVAAFQAAGFDLSSISFRHPLTNKAHVDLWEANRCQMIDFGLPESQIHLSGICTYLEHETYFSARRLGIQSGRNLTGIMIL